MMRYEVKLNDLCVLLCPRLLICNDKLRHRSPLKSIINYEGSMRIKLLLLRNRKSQNNLTTKDKNSNLIVCGRKRD